LIEIIQINFSASGENHQRYTELPKSIIVKTNNDIVNEFQ